MHNKSRESIDNLINQAIDLKCVLTGVSNSATIQQVFWGKNYTGGFVPIETNNDNMGYIFCTCPDFNLTYNNIRPHRELIGLLANNNGMSTPHAIRCLLDRRSHRRGEPGFDSKLVDKCNPFLSLLENAIISADGWPDSAGGSWTSPEGRTGEQTLKNRGLRGLRRTFPLTLSLQNFKSNGPYALIETWACLNELKQLNLNSHIENVRANRWDNQVCFYRFILDTTKTTVVDYCKTGPAILKSSPTGAQFGYNLTSPEARVETVSAQFEVAGYRPHDLIAIRCFNSLVAKYNIKMNDINRHREMTLVPFEQRSPYFDFCSYPRINPFTLEWQLWVENIVYDAITSLNDLPNARLENHNREDPCLADLNPKNVKVQDHVKKINVTTGFRPDDFWSV